MSNTAHLPSIVEASEFFGSLFGLDVHGSEVSGQDPQTIMAVATYVDDQDQPAAYFGCDIAAACILGAALTQIPLGGVRDAIESGEITQNIKDNLCEVLNIGVNLFANPGGQRIVLRDVLFADDCQPARDAISSGGLISVKLDVQRYGDGIVFLR